jgi:hypothetical protein
MSKFLKLVNKDEIFEFLEKSIISKSIFLITPSEIGDVESFHAAEIRIEKILNKQTLKLRFLSGKNRIMDSNITNKKYVLKEEATGIFFKTIISLDSNGIASAVFPKLLNIKNTRFKNRIKIDNNQRCKISGQKKTNYSESMKFSGNLSDFHFNGLGIHIAKNYISYFSKNDIIEITRIANIDLEMPVIGEVKFISKAPNSPDLKKLGLHKIGILTSEKIPASIIFELNKMVVKRFA